MAVKIALAGNPNCGKTTLFNALTGANQYVGNWPGVTVEKKEGKLIGHKDVDLVDLPGIYSLSPYTLEEVVARNYLIGEQPDAIINIVDGTNIERNLYLTTQIIELGIPVLMAVNMMDIVKKNGDTINIKALGEKLGCEVVEISALKKTGIKETAEKAIQIAKSGKSVQRVHHFADDVESTIAGIEDKLGLAVAENQKRFFAIKLLERDSKISEVLKSAPNVDAEIKALEDKYDDDTESIITNERYQYISSIIGSCVKKISEYITKKVADKLIGMCKTDKEAYEKYWDDISPFIKFGCLKDEKFCDKINDYILFKDINDKYQTLPELLAPVADDEKTDAESADASDDTKKADNTDANASDENKEPEKNTVYYVTDVVQQGQYIKLFKEQGMNAVILDHNIDTSFITQLEQRNDHYKFMRIDADLTESLKDESGADLTEATTTLSEVFKKALNNDKLTVKVENLKNADVASVLTLSEQGRRMQDMMKMYAAGGMGGMDPSMFAADQTLTLNANNELVKYILDNKDSEHVPMFAEQLYDLAMLSNQPLSVDQMTKFVKRSNDIMLLLTK